MKRLATLSAAAWLCLVAVTGNVYARALEHVTVEQGKLQGKVENNIAVFKGVPFAQPPVGELRWRPPQPAKAWQGVKTAYEFAPAPMQAGEPPVGKSEDSLYLNIWTPAQSQDEQLPVFVWIYGGGFSFGMASDPLFNGTQLAEKDVIVVTIAYRVGQLGFLAHPELSAESPDNVSGNYGLLDQIAALQWIRDNIAAFGGDPKNVTIAGESAGGISVSMLAASPLAKDLFHKAISQSGGSFGPTRKVNYPGENMVTLEQAEAEGLEYVKRFGTTSIAELRAMPAETFIPRGWSLPGGWPIVDGHVIPDDQFTLYEKGNFNDVPALVGYNSDEGVSFVRGNDAKQFIDGIHTRFGPYAPQLIDAYSVSDTAVTRSARNLIRDAAFGWHTWSWARLQTRHGEAPAYLYYFDQHPDYPKDSPQYNQGSPHGQDIAFVFKQLDKANPQVSKTDLALSESIATYWTNFVKSGNPNGQDLAEWPAFSADAASVMYFQQTPHVGPVPDKPALETLDEYFHWRRTAEGKAWANQ
ncbi:carboxylesterase/lipase family protein [Alteromonas gilva]|uniref:Carboxylic ester hydrolase n=1 Tax=Alteromonas gilva TaxID=2987522 RepID=A0ABT5L1L4_9ALTE|nr:carboxylesterase family protein [Alteromonas gilva]MDC8829688.1 carboxylesterase family protein [Alteromonas gilva]